MKFILFIIFCFCVFFQCYSQNMDIELLRKINVNRNLNLDEPFIIVTKSAAPISIIVPVGIFATGLIYNKDKLKKDGLMIAASLAVTTVIVTGLKYSINRTRPFNEYKDIEQVIPVSTASFPSGHTSTAFSTASSLCLAFPKWYVIAPAFMWASAVGYSRMHLGEHYPSDVFAGAIIGTGSAYLSYRVQKWYFQKRKEKVSLSE